MSVAPTAFMLHGFLGVGKTTLAMRLAEERQAIRFTHDEWMVRLYGQDPPAEQFGRLAAAVEILMEQTWARCLELGVNVVLDSGFWSRIERDRVVKLIRRCGATPVIYKLDCDEEAALARIAKRNLHGTSSLYISRATYQTLRARFEPLGEDEPHIDLSC